MILSISYLVLCLLSTFILEAIVMLIFRYGKKWLKAGIIVNTITNPVINCILLLVAVLEVSEAVYVIIALLLEVVVVFLEAYFYGKMLGEDKKTCLKASFICNVFSFVVGIVLMALLMKAFPFYREPTFPLNPLNVA